MCGILISKVTRMDASYGGIRVCVKLYHPIPSRPILCFLWNTRGCRSLALDELCNSLRIRLRGLVDQRVHRREQLKTL